MSRMGDCTSAEGASGSMAAVGSALSIPARERPRRGEHMDGRGKHLDWLPRRCA